MNMPQRSCCSQTVPKMFGNAEAHMWRAFRGKSLFHPHKYTHLKLTSYVCVGGNCRKRNVKPSNHAACSVPKNAGNGRESWERQASTRSQSCR